MAAPLVRAAWMGTAAFALVAVPAAITAAGPVEAVAVAVDLVLFAAGTVALALAYGRAVQRSRTEDVTVARVFLLAGGSVPLPVRRHLLATVAVQTAVALATAAARPYTPLAFGILVPAYGLGLAALWAARHGTFPPRPSPTG